MGKQPWNKWYRATGRVNGCGRNNGHERKNGYRNSSAWPLGGRIARGGIRTVMGRSNPSRGRPNSHRRKNDSANSFTGLQGGRMAMRILMQGCGEEEMPQGG